MEANMQVVTIHPPRGLTWSDAIELLGAENVRLYWNVSRARAHLRRGDFDADPKRKAEVCAWLSARAPELIKRGLMSDHQ
jgi:hypothetical protein